MNLEDFEAMKKYLASQNINPNNYPPADLLAALGLPTVTIIKNIKLQDPERARLFLTIIICSILQTCNDSLDESLNILEKARSMMINIDKDLDKYRPGPMEDKK